ncbi:MAG: type IV toxin-antitoxin system AbiEi family antitoxin [Deltaproteobacteria bacterium]|nr:type IV toxin-antitoxin system AbiEi family antitoxin [Deltaproteobacteria bacterium]
MAYLVNMQSMSKRELERALLKKLPEVLGEIGWSKDLRIQEVKSGGQDVGYDAEFKLSTPAGKAVRLRVDIKHDLRPSAFESWVRMRRQAVAKAGTFPVLAVPAMSERLADLCRSHGWSWYDLAGNCRIDVPGLLLVERRGIPSVYRPPRAKANLSSAAAGRVIRALLSPEHAGRIWTHRGVLDETSWKPDETIWRSHPDQPPVSIGLVNKVLRHLRDEGFVEDSERGGVRLRDPRGLLEAWNQAYRFDRHQRLNYFTLLKGAELEKALDKVRLFASGMVVYASFSAAERQAPHVRQEKTWLYAEAHCVGGLESNAKPVDSGENLVVLVPDDIGVLRTYLPADSRLPSTDPAQTYVDLRHSGGRGEEAAQAILEQVLLPAWKKAGLA